MRYTVSDFPAKGNQLTSKQIVELAQLTEQVGIDRFSITDFPFHQDCIPLMTACLVGTERLEVESLVTTPYLRMPDVTACTWATMAELSGGRAILGIGKGGARPPIWAAPWGYDRPNGRVAVREMIETCRTMWAGGRPVFEGRALHTSALPLDFPFNERVPVLVAARGLKMLKLGAEIADIVHIASPFAGPKYLRERVDYVRNCALAVGRDLDELEIDVTVSLSVSRDGAWARDVARMTTAAAILWVANAEAHVRDTDDRGRAASRRVQRSRFDDRGHCQRLGHVDRRAIAATPRRTHHRRNPRSVLDRGRAERVCRQDRRADRRSAGDHRIAVQVAAVVHR